MQDRDWLYIQIVLGVSRIFQREVLESFPWGKATIQHEDYTQVQNERGMEDSENLGGFGSFEIYRGVFWMW